MFSMLRPGKPEPSNVFSESRSRSPSIIKRPFSFLIRALSIRANLSSTSAKLRFSRYTSRGRQSIPSAKYGSASKRSGLYTPKPFRKTIFSQSGYASGALTSSSRLSDKSSVPRTTVFFISDGSRTRPRPLKSRSASTIVLPFSTRQ